MKISGKLAAFTIIEVSVSMLIAAITIAITYTSYRVVTSSYRQFDKKNKQISVFVLADKLLKKDISDCSRIVGTVNGFSLIMQEGQIHYNFQPDYILRNQYNLRTDTLFVRSSEPKSLFEQKEVFEGDLIDEFSFSAILEDKTISMSYRKEYSAEELFK